METGTKPGLSNSDVITCVTSFLMITKCGYDVRDKKNVTHQSKISLDDIKYFRLKVIVLQLANK